MNNSFYCPYCARNINPEKDDDGYEVFAGDGGLIFVHDDMPHDEQYNFEDLQ